MHSWTEVQVPPQAPDVLAEVFGDEAVVVQLRTGAYYAFDAAATVLWTQLWQGNTLAPPIGRRRDAHDARRVPPLSGPRGAQYISRPLCRS